MSAYSSSRGIIPSTTNSAHSIVAALSIKFCPQLVLVESPLPTLLCFSFCSVSVSDSSAYTAIVVVESIPVNAAAVKKAAMINDLFIAHKILS